MAWAQQEINQKDQVMAEVRDSVTQLERGKEDAEEAINELWQMNGKLEMELEHFHWNHHECTSRSNVDHIT